MKNTINRQRDTINEQKKTIEQCEDMLYIACSQAHNLDRFLAYKGYRREFIEFIKGSKQSSD